MKVALNQVSLQIATFDRESAAVKEDLRLLASVKDEMARNADIKATVTENLMHDLETARKESVVLENAFAELKVQLDTLREQKVRMSTLIFLADRARYLSAQPFWLRLKSQFFGSRRSRTGQLQHNPTL